jgi:hypothetical protein
LVEKWQAVYVEGVQFFLRYAARENVFDFYDVVSQLLALSCRNNTTTSVASFFRNLFEYNPELQKSIVCLKHTFEGDTCAHWCGNSAQLVKFLFHLVPKFPMLSPLLSSASEITTRYHVGDTTLNSEIEINSLRQDDFRRILRADLANGVFGGTPRATIEPPAPIQIDSNDSENGMMEEEARLDRGIERFERLAKANVTFQASDVSAFGQALSAFYARSSSFQGAKTSTPEHYGCVYASFNPQTPTDIKIGKTADTTPYARVAKFNTHIRGKCQVIDFVTCKNYSFVETMVHFTLKNFKIKGEVFGIQVERIKAIFDGVRRSLTKDGVLDIGKFNRDPEINKFCNSQQQQLLCNGSQHRLP